MDITILNDIINLIKSTISLEYIIIYFTLCITGFIHLIILRLIRSVKLKTFIIINQLLILYAMFHANIALINFIDEVDLYRSFTMLSIVSISLFIILIVASLGILFFMIYRFLKPKNN